SALMVSPAATSTSMTSTSLKSPMSGTLISTSLLMSVLPSSVVRVGFFRIDAVFLDGLGDLGDGDLALVGQRTQRGQDDEMTVDFEVLAQFVAEIRAAETIGAQHAIRAIFGHERTDLVGEQLHIVGRRDDRSFGFF